MSSRAWPLRVSLRFQAYLQEDARAGCPLRRLRLLKRAISEATWDLHLEISKQRRAQPAARQDDLLGWTVRLIRSLEAERWSQVRRCCDAYPYLQELLSAHPSQSCSPALLLRLRDHASELAKTALLRDLRGTAAQQSSLDPQELQLRRQRMQVRLRRLMPGTSSSLAAVRTEDGRIVTDPGDIAEALRNHWAEVFRRKELDATTLEEWLLQDFGACPAGPDGAPLPSPRDRRWRLCPRDVGCALRSSPDTSPGPDGIPFVAYRRLERLGVTTLYEAAMALQGEMAEQQLVASMEDPSLGGHDFNHSLLVFLPKKRAGTDPLLGDFYAVTDVRPFSIANTDNRLISNAIRMRIEPLVGRWVSEAQRGFIGGRSMLANVVEIDHEAQVISLRHPRGAIVLFDFAAAFPSLGHSYLIRVLEHLRLPPALLCYVRMLYGGNRCQIACGGQRFAGFELTAGVRQGCPLSPLLFAVAADLLLRRLSRMLPSCLTRAFADDVAMAIPDVSIAFPVLIPLFQDFARISGLELNVGKSVCIPLWLESLADIRVAMAREYSPWSALAVESFGVYLGIAIGPGSAGRSWDKPLLKYGLRIAHLLTQGPGLHAIILAYHALALSVLMFVGQLEAPPAAALEAERAALVQLVPGPHAWILPADPPEFHNLEALGQSRSFHSLVLSCRAAQARVVRYENVLHGGLKINQRSRELDEAERSVQQADRQLQWRSWYGRSFPRTLRHVWRGLAAEGLTGTVLEDMASRNAPRPHTEEVTQRIRRRFQNTVLQELRARGRPLLTHRLRHKMARWPCPVFPRVAIQRLEALLPRLPRLLPPRVTAAVLRTLYNGWVTDRRFQHAGACRFGCADADDSIEHYACCRAVRTFAHSYLGLCSHDECRDDRVARFVSLGCWHGEVTDAEVVKRAILQYAVYRSFLLHRHTPGSNARLACQALAQFAREAVRYDPSSRRYVGRWLSDYGQDLLDGRGPMELVAEVHDDDDGIVTEIASS